MPKGTISLLLVSRYRSYRVLLFRLSSIYLLHNDAPSAIRSYFAIEYTFYKIGYSRSISDFCFLLESNLIINTYPYITITSRYPVCYYSVKSHEQIECIFIPSFAIDIFGLTTFNDPRSLIHLRSEFYRRTLREMKYIISRLVIGLFI